MKPARVLPAVAAICAAAFGQDAGKRYSLSEPDRWTVGDVVTERHEKTTERSFVMTRADGPCLLDNKTTTREAWTIVLRCDQTQKDGSNPTGLVRVDSWVISYGREDRSISSGPLEDRSLEGAVFAVSESGWTLLTPSTKPTAAARGWLDQKFMTGFIAVRMIDSLDAPASLAVGDGWELNEDVVRRTALDEPLRLAFGDLKARAVLTEVKPSSDAGRDDTCVTVDVHAALVDDVKSRRDVQDAKKGAVSAHGEVRGVPGRRPFGGSVALDVGVEVRDAGRTVNSTQKTTTSLRESSIRGGTPPEPPKRDPAAGSTCRFAHAPSWSDGDTFTDSGATTRTETRTSIAADGKPRGSDKNAFTITWNAVLRKNGDKGHAVVWIRDWKSDSGDGRPDECLRGTSFDLTFSGRTPRDAKSPLSEAAKTWLATEFRDFPTAAGDDGLRVAVTPIRAVGAGDSWEADGGAAASYLCRWLPGPVDSQHSVAKARLERVVDGVATVSYEVHAPIESSGSKGGERSIDVTGTTTGPLADWVRVRAIDERTSVKMLIPLEDGESVRVEVTQTRKLSRVAGGEMPKEDK